MSLSLAIARGLNKTFKLPVHPFNLANDNRMTYAEWQFEKGANTIKFYSEFISPEKMFRGRDILDIGCGAAGKSIYYASLGANVTGLEILEKYRDEAEALAEKLGQKERFRFVCADAAHTDFADGSFDTIIANDAMEHVGDPDGVLRECLRILKPGGRLYLNFPPYYHPFGAHLSDAIGIPWVHAFFSEKTLVSLYKECVAHLPDGNERLEFRISKRPDGTEYFSYINHMTLKRFRHLPALADFKVAYRRNVPLRGFLAPLAVLPGFREFFVKMSVWILEKPE